MQSLNTTVGRSAMKGLKCHWSRAGFLLAACLLLSFAGLARADKFSFSESLKDKLYSYRDEGDVWYETGQVGKFRLAGAASWPEPVDISMINEGTQLFLSFGDLELNLALGDADIYNPAKRSATYFLSTHYSERDDYEKLIVDVKAVVKWSTKGFSVVITGKGGGESGVYPVLADFYYTHFESGPVSDFIELAVGFNGFEYHLPVAITGKVSRKTINKGGEEGQSFDMTSVSIRGKPDLD